jgi:hypothetical protein
LRAAVQITQLVVRVGRGLWGSLRRLGYLVAMAGLIGLLSLAVSLPLWYLASMHRKLYTAGVFVAGAAAVLVALTRRTGQAMRASGGIGAYVRTAVLPILKAVGLAAGSLAVLYGAVLLASLGRVVSALVATGAWVLILGLLRYGRKDKP